MIPNKVFAACYPLQPLWIMVGLLLLAELLAVALVCYVNHRDARRAEKLLK